MKRILYLLLVSLVCLASSLTILYAAETQNNIPIPPSTHPRVLITPNDLNNLRTKLNRTEMNAVKQAITDNCNSITQQSIIDTCNQVNNNGSLKKVAFELCDKIESEALMSLLLKSTDPAKSKTLGQNAISHVKYLLENIDFPAVDYTIPNRSLLTGALVYDWCYEYLSAEDEIALRNNLIAVAKTQCVIYPISNTPIGSLTGHSCGETLLYSRLAAGIALYDKDSAMYYDTSNFILNQLVPARNFIYQGGMHHQGDSYGISRSLPELYGSILYNKIGAGQIFDSSQSQLLYRWIYTSRPDNDQLREGDSYNSSGSTPNAPWDSPLFYMINANYFKDGYFKYALDKQLKLTGYANTYYMKRQAVNDLIFREIDLPAKSFDTLPLTRYFGYPFGTMVARTGWQDGLDSPAVVAEMKVGAYQFNNHDHFDSGSFQIYYKGALAIDSGLYETEDANGNFIGYGSEHDINYHKRTIAHNCMLIYDPAEKFTYIKKTVSNDGGQRLINDAKEPIDLNELNAKGHQVADILAHQFGPDKQSPTFSYLKGDLSKAYTSKVQKHLRSFMFLNLKRDAYPAALIVYDKVTSSNPSFKKSWTLHSIEEPTISNNTFTVRRTQQGYSGQLVTNTLLPSANNLKIEKVGGTGKEFYVDGKNYALTPLPKTRHESGAWRIEVSPRDSQLSDDFLNVIQIMDNGTSAVTPDKIDLDRFVGVKLHDKVVLFSKSGEKVSSSFEFTIDSSRTQLEYVIADMKQGSYYVYINNEAIGTYTVTEEGSVLSFKGIPGTVEVQKASAPTRPINLKLSLQGQNVVLSWDANKESNLSGYHVYLNNSKVTSSPIKVTQYIFSDLTMNQVYDFAVSAINTSGEESLKSIHLKQILIPNNFPMSIVSITPKGNALDIPLKTTIMVDYSKTIASNFPIYVDMIDENDNRFSIQALASNNVLKLELDNLSPSTQYTVRIPKVSDAFGNSSEPYMYTFTTIATQETSRNFHDKDIGFDYPSKFNLVTTGNNEYRGEYANILLQLTYYDYPWPSIEEHKKALIDLDNASRKTRYFEYETYMNCLTKTLKKDYESRTDYCIIYSNGMGNKIAEISLSTKIPISQLSKENSGLLKNTASMIADSLVIYNTTPCNNAQYTIGYHR